MDDVTSRYRKFDTSLVSDALDQHGIEGVVTDIAPVAPTHAAVGRATTVRFERVDTDDVTNFPNAMFDAMESERMLVMDGPDDLSCWGGMASRLGHDADVAGVVTNGRVRDADDIRAGEFPVFSSGTTPLTGQRRMRVAATNSSVDLGGRTVERDDIIMADATGIVVVPSEHAEAVAETAESLLSAELLIGEKIENGATHDDLRDHEF